MFTNETDGGFIEFSIKSDGAVLSHPSSGMLPEIISKICWGGSQAFHMGGESLKRTLPGGRMFSLMVDLIEPQVKGLIEFP